MGTRLDICHSGCKRLLLAFAPFPGLVFVTYRFTNGEVTIQAALNMFMFLSLIPTADNFKQLHRPSKKLSWLGKESRFSRLDMQLLK